MMDLADLGAEVRRARKTKKLTQAQLGAKLGVSRQVILRLEKGESTDIGLAKVLVILQAVGLEAVVRPAVTARPTLEEMYAENEAERLARNKRLGARRTRV